MADKSTNTTPEQKLPPPIEVSKFNLSGSKILLGVVGLGIIVGAALIWASGGLAWAGMSGLMSAGPLASFVTQAGMSLVLGGVASILAPTPKTPDPKESPENTPSYLFNGAVNTTAQGHPVPIGYGRLIVGSAVISASIVTTEYT